MKKIFVNIFILILLMSCMKETASVRDTKVNPINSKIINGDLVESKLNGDLYRTTVRLILRGSTGRSICTGSLISPNVVVTAAHCLKGIDIVEVQSDLLEGQIEGNKFVYNSEYVDGDQKNIFLGIKKTINDLSHDIGLVFLSQKLDKNIFSSMKILQRSDIVKKDMSAYVAGFSPFEKALFKNIFENFSNQKNQDSYTRGESLLRVKNSVILNDISKNDFFISIGNFAGGTCFGDSGGPLFMKLNGKNVLLGVASHVTGNCENEAHYTNISKYKEWIIESIQSENGELPEFVSFVSVPFHVG